MDDQDLQELYDRSETFQKNTHSLQALYGLSLQEAMRECYKRSVEEGD